MLCTDPNACVCRRAGAVGAKPIKRIPWPKPGTDCHKHRGAAGLIGAAALLATSATELMLRSAAPPKTLRGDAQTNTCKGRVPNKHLQRLCTHAHVNAACWQGRSCYCHDFTRRHERMTYCGNRGLARAVASRTEPSEHSSEHAPSFGKSFVTDQFYFELEPPQ